MKGVAQAPAIAEEDINVMFSTNVTGLINMTQAVLPTFKKRADGGKGDIINIGSIAGREPYAGGSIYCSSKAAVKAFTDSLRKELVATRIRIIEVDPGQVETVCKPANEGEEVKILIGSRNSRSSDSMAIRRRLMLFIRKSTSYHRKV